MIRRTERAGAGCAYGSGPRRGHPGAPQAAATTGFPVRNQHQTPLPSFQDPSGFSQLHQFRPTQCWEPPLQPPLPSQQQQQQQETPQVHLSFPPQYEGQADQPLPAYIPVPPRIGSTASVLPYAPQRPQEPQKGRLHSARSGQQLQQAISQPSGGWSAFGDGNMHSLSLHDRRQELASLSDDEIRAQILHQHPGDPRVLRDYHRDDLVAIAEALN